MFVQIKCDWAQNNKSFQAKETYDELVRMRNYIYFMVLSKIDAESQVFIKQKQHSIRKYQKKKTEFEFNLHEMN